MSVAYFIELKFRFFLFYLLFFELNILYGWLKWSVLEYQ